MKTLFFILVLTLTLNSNAQITKGNWLVGGDASFFSNRTELELSDNTIETNYLIITPNIGYFFMDKLATGIDLQFSFVDPGKSVNSQSYGFNPFLRYYFLKIDSQINLFTQVSYNLGFGENGQGTRFDTTGYGLEIGTALFFNNVVGLELFLSYDKLTNTFDKTDTRITKQFLVGLGLQIHLER